MVSARGGSAMSTRGGVSLGKSAWHMIGIVLMMVSVFPLFAGLFLLEASVTSPLVAPVLIVSGCILFVAGTVLYKVVKTD